METLLKGIYLGFILVALALNSGCGGPPQEQSGTATTGNQVVITVFNSGTQDPSMGTTYSVKANSRVEIPSIVLRTEGQTLQDGLGVGIDLGNSLGQCYYTADTSSQTVFTLSSCTNSLFAGESIDLKQGQVLSVWSYNHVNSSDSVVELVLQGTLN